MVDSHQMKTMKRRKIMPRDIDDFLELNNIYEQGIRHTDREYSKFPSTYEQIPQKEFLDAVRDNGSGCVDVKMWGDYNPLINSHDIADRLQNNRNYNMKITLYYMQGKGHHVNIQAANLNVGAIVNFNEKGKWVAIFAFDSICFLVTEDDCILMVGHDTKEGESGGSDAYHMPITEEDRFQMRLTYDLEMPDRIPESKMRWLAELTVNELKYHEKLIGKRNVTED